MAHKKDKKGIDRWKNFDDKIIFAVAETGSYLDGEQNQ